MSTAALPPTPDRAAHPFPSPDSSDPIDGAGDPVVASRSPLAALPGDAAARLFAGPPASAGAESLLDHFERLGPLPPAVRAAGSDERSWLLATIEASGLRGRGGGEFPMAQKLAAANRAPGAPIVVVNGAEGEPASRKDRTLLELRPHLVLDGATVAAAACGASEIVVYLRPDSLASWPAVRQAIEARQRAQYHLSITVLASPGTYVAGESGSVVAALEGGRAIPYRRTVPVASSGAGGRPTVVGNVETHAHLALIARFGAAWFAEAGSAECAGSSLVTLGGDVAVPGLVVEVLAPMPAGQLLAEFGGLEVEPPAVLVGGYFGHWVSGPTFCAMPLDRGVLPRCRHQARLRRRGAATRGGLRAGNHLAAARLPRRRERRPVRPLCLRPAGTCRRFRGLARRAPRPPGAEAPPPAKLVDRRPGSVRPS